jgi:hypothetical protein
MRAKQRRICLFVGVVCGDRVLTGCSVRASNIDTGDYPILGVSAFLGLGEDVPVLFHRLSS